MIGAIFMKFGRAPTTCRTFRSRVPGAARSLKARVTDSDHSRLKHCLSLPADPQKRLDCRSRLRLASRALIINGVLSGAAGARQINLYRTVHPMTNRALTVSCVAFFAFSFAGN